MILARRTVEMAHAAVVAERESLEKDKARFAAEMERERGRAHESFMALCAVFREEITALHTLWDTVRSQDRLIAEGRAYIALMASTHSVDRESALLLEWQTVREATVAEGNRAIADITARSGGQIKFDVVGDELIAVAEGTDSLLPSQKP